MSFTPLAAVVRRGTWLGQHACGIDVASHGCQVRREAVWVALLAATTGPSVRTRGEDVQKTWLTLTCGAFSLSQEGTVTQKAKLKLRKE